MEDVRRAGLEGKLGERMVAVITDTPEGKGYRPVEPTDLAAFEEAKRLSETVEGPSEYIVPEINAPGALSDAGAHRSISVDIYGLKKWANLFNPRQLLVMHCFIGCLNEVTDELRKMPSSGDLADALMLYLALWLSKISTRCTSLGVWDTVGEKFQSPFGRQSLAMTWDYPEVNVFGELTASSISLLEWTSRYLAHESSGSTLLSPTICYCGDAATMSDRVARADVVVTDPPYFDAIAYADLADFFYVWLKRGLHQVMPPVFSTPQTPKTEEAVAHRHRHGGSREKGKAHFQRKLSLSLREANRISVASGVLAVMFAHQSTDAWVSLINALFEAGSTVKATYPIETELTGALKKNVSALASSITVICRPRQVGAAASLREVRREIEKVVAQSVHRFWDYGFRGADLIVACYGPAVGVFGQYERVERADGTRVEVPELLELAKEAALKAIAGEFTGDPLSRLYFVWANLYGTSEQAWDDARLVAQVGGDSENAVEVAKGRGLFQVNGATCRLALLNDRAARPRLGEDESAPLIDQLHRSLLFWKEERRPDLVSFLAIHGLFDHSAFWKLAQALFEVLPHGCEDWKLVSALLGERETLRLEAKRAAALKDKTLFDGKI
ncbi:MAG: DUF1156 domain-containing protein [Planctomycetes bacterium]|nr:DUF1156 domain-containing protein [Planctomycetota bacterium]